MDKKNRPHSRIKDLIDRARSHLSQRDSAPAISHMVMNEMWSDLVDDQEMLQTLVASGLNNFIRSALTRWELGENNKTGKARSAQLSMWPVVSREWVETINRERVFVPSRLEFVELVPDAITPDEIREAAEHLIEHGEDCIRRGNALHRLADLSEQPMLTPELA